MEHVYKAEAKIRAFYTNPKYTELLNSEAPLSAKLWEAIFVFYFESYPRDKKNWNPRYKRGSTDPRWDTLLHEHNGLKAQTKLRLENKQHQQKVA